MSEQSPSSFWRGRPLGKTRMVAVFYAVVVGAVTLFTAINDLLGASIPVDLKVAPFWLKVNPTMKLDGITGHVVSGGYDHASLMISGLGLDARLWFAGANLVAGAASVIVAITVALLCTRIGNGDPFDRVMPRAIDVSAFAVLAGGILWQAFNQIAGWRVIDETFHAYSASWKIKVPGITEFSRGWPSGSTSFTIDFWPIGIALGLFAISAVFRYGSRLSQERGRLAEEVKGLV